jgi:5-(carboxyamino)imidazole ribonucleotide mutase
MAKPRILILVGSDSDLPVLERGLAFLKENRVPYSLDVCSAHRNPERLVEYAKEARQAGYAVIVAVAGMAAHLPGVIASHTTLPVIGVPVGSGALKGIDALLSIVQMPPGVPVATVGIDASKNAAILACQILAVKDRHVAAMLERAKDGLRRESEAKSAKLKGAGKA